MARKKGRRAAKKQAPPQVQWFKFVAGGVIGLLIVGAVIGLLGPNNAPRQEPLVNQTQPQPAAGQAEQSSTTGPAANVRVAPEVGALAPDFELVNLAGERVRLSDFRGQPVVLNFMHTW